MAFLSLMLFFQLSFAQDWATCQKKTDCVLIKGCCGWMSVNKKFSTEIEFKNKTACRQVECFVQPDFSKRKPFVCEKNKCTIKD